MVAPDDDLTDDVAPDDSDIVVPRGGAVPTRAHRNQKRLLAIITSLVAGVFYGFTFVPVIYIQDHPEIVRNYTILSEFNSHLNSSVPYRPENRTRICFLSLYWNFLHRIGTYDWLRYLFQSKTSNCISKIKFIKFRIIHLLHPD